MFDYVVSYDVAAFVIILFFSAFYFSRRKYNNIRNRLFSCLLINIIGCISFDLAGVFTLQRPEYFPIGIRYFVNMTYFMFSGLMAVILSLYFLKQTRTDYKLKSSYIYKICFSIPFIFFAFTTLTTPWLHLLFYIDSEDIYGQGSLCYVLLLIVVLYLIFSFITMTFSREKLSLRKRMPYYIYMLFLAAAILLQYLFPKYLLYGFAEAVSTVFIYFSNHNPSDMTDETTELGSRRAFFNNLKERKADEAQYTVVGFGLQDLFNILEEDSSFDYEFILTLIGRFLKQHYGKDNSFYLGGFCFAVICKADSDNAETVKAELKHRFEEPWTVRGVDTYLGIGTCTLIFPTDIANPARFIDELETGITISFDHKEHSVGIDAIRSDQQNRIRFLEEQNQQYDDLRRKAENSEKSKTLFLAQMSHEIRTPMTAILGMTELVLRETDNDRVKEYANAIMASGRSLISIINDILDFSKIEAGKLEIIPDNYCITSTVNDLISGIVQKISEKRLDLSVDLDPSIPSILLGDELRVKQIISNILSNACKYTEKGCITLRVGWESLKDNQCNLLVEVSDTGIGIKPENLDKIFNGFERFDSIQNKYIQGTGLGLSICQLLVKAMNGDISVKSTYGKGTTFTVKLPQTVIDSEECIDFKVKDSDAVLAYAGSEHEYNDYVRCLSSAGLSYDVVTDAAEFDRLLGENQYTHLFMTLTEYNRRQSAGDPVAKDKRLVIALYYRQYTAKIGDHRSVHMPVYSMSLASILSEESLPESQDTMTSVPSYEAPDAHILVVDDNIVNLQIMCGLLECHHMHIDTADSGTKALTLTRTRKYDIMFIDHMMPGRDGVETLHDIRNEISNSNKETPAVAFTANAVSGMKEFFLEQGFNDFLSKPINISRMEEIILTLIPNDKICVKEETEENKDGAESENFDVQEAQSNVNAGQSLTEEAFEVKGIDMEKALFYTGGSYSILKSILEAFYSDGLNKLPVIRKLAEDEDIDNFRIEIHAVKSLCKGIGADDVSGQALALETAAKESNIEFIRANYDSCLKNYEELLKAVGSGLASLTETKEADISANAVSAADSGSSKSEESYLDSRELMTCIGALLDAYEAELAEKLAEKLAADAPDEDTKNAADGILKCLRLYDYEGAKAFLQQ